MENKQNVTEDLWLCNFSIKNVGLQLLHPAFCDVIPFGLTALFGKPIHLTKLISVMKGVDLIGAYVEEKEIAALVDATIKKIFDEPQTIKKIHEKAYVYNDAYFEAGKKALTLDFSSLDNVALLEAYKKLLDAQVKGHGQAIITTWFLDSYKQHFSQLLLEKTKHFVAGTQRDVAETFSVLTTMPKNSLATVEEIESMKIVQAIQESDEKDVILAWDDITQMPTCTLHDTMEAHYQKWHWMPFAYLGPAYTREYYLEVWKGLVKEGHDAKKRIAELEQRPAKIKEEREKLFEELHIDAHMRTIFDIAADIAYLKGYRKDVMYHGMYALSFILKEIARRLDVELEEMHLLTSQGVERVLAQNQQLNKGILDKRKKKFCLLYNFENQTFKEYNNADVNGFLATKQFEKEEIADVDTLKGMIACMGHAVGTVKQINSPDDIPKMSEGDILVSHTTMPSLLPAMKKAAAIITEDGGITCHAAIVSRELKIPCITGIKIATKVLQDGDRVEVNANEGIVRRVKE